jgi:hypothetical protein
MKETPSPIMLLEQKIILSEGKALVVPERLASPDKLILEAQESLTKKNRYIHDGVVSTSFRQEINISVAPENVGRALRLMDTFIKVIRKRGHSIVFKNYSYLIQIQGETFEFNLKEKLERVPKPLDKGVSWQEYDFFPTGIFRFNVKFHWINQEWKDGKLPLERQLAKIIAKLEMDVEESKQRDLEREIQRAQEKEKELVALEKKKRKEEELLAFIRLLKKAERWKKVTMLRDYINVIETETIASDNNSEENLA